jgi:hypothetical protein
MKVVAEFKEMGMVSEPVNESGSQPLVTKDLGPVREGQIGGDDDCHLLMKSGAELEKPLSPIGGKGDEAQFIQDDEVELESGGEEGWQTLFSLSQGQFVDQGGGIVKAGSLASVKTRKQAEKDLTLHTECCSSLRYPNAAV